MRTRRYGARMVERSEAGFTLIELMMVVLIIAILMAILLPTFAGARHRANDRAMQSSLRNAVTASKAIYVDGEDYTLATPARLNAEGIPIRFVDAATPPTRQNEISVDPVTQDYIVVSGQSKSGTCFYAADNAAGSGTVFAKSSTAVTCEASSAPAQGHPLWLSSW